jgi:hypothetical protein
MQIDGMKELVVRANKHAFNVQRQMISKAQADRYQHEQEVQRLMALAGAGAMAVEAEPAEPMAVEPVAAEVEPAAAEPMAVEAEPVEPVAAEVEPAADVIDVSQNFLSEFVFSESFF